jgi:hypothetical protein
VKKPAFILVFLSLMVLSASAQLKERDNLLGGSLGFWAKQNVPTFGINYENQVTQAGIGTIGIGGVFRFYSYSYNYSNGDSRKYSFTSFGFQANYNFNQIGDGKFVPFVGLVLGYNTVSSTYTDVSRNAVYINDYAYNSGMWVWAQVGMRYFFSSHVAGSVRLNGGNYDFNTLELGIDFRF